MTFANNMKSSRFKKKSYKIVCIILSVLTLFLNQAIADPTGLLFNVVGTGTLSPINFNLCLDGYGPLSCQNFTLNSSRLIIRTTRPNHTYPAAGIKINTPGFFPIGCTPIPNGYCIFSVSDTVPAQIDISIAFNANISASVENMVLAALGTTRIITITNTSSEAAFNVDYTVSPALPSGSSIAPANCGTIAPGGHCVLSITPGSANVTPSVLRVQGSNTNAVNVNIYTLELNSSWQGGFVFFIDDTTPPSTSITGEVVFDLSTLGSTFWSNISFEAIPGARSMTNGQQNTDAIVLSQGPGDYAANICNNYTGGGANNWYLPAICQLSTANTPDANCPSGTPTAADINYPADNSFWSSTEIDSNNAWGWGPRFTPSSSQSIGKSESLFIVCAHVFVPLS